MQCMKCGREIAADEVFCVDCLDEMKKYPIKPGTIALIPPRTAQTKRVTERRPATTEQRLASMTRRVRVLSFLLTLTLALLIAVGALTISLLRESDVLPNLGQNYSTATGGETENVSRETFSEPIE